MGVELSPVGHAIVVPEFAFELAQDLFRFRKILRGEVRDGKFEKFRFEQCAQFEEFLDIAGREGGDDSAAIGNDADEALGVELAESFTDGNAAHTKLEGDGILTELRAFGDFSTDDPIAQAVGDLGSEGTARNRGGRLAIEFWLRCFFGGR